MKTEEGDPQHQQSDFSKPVYYQVDCQPTCAGCSGDNLIINNQNNSVPPKEYRLINFPNPFNPVTKISFTLPKSAFVTLTVYDITGKTVSKLLNEFKPAGSYEVEFDGTELSSGIYIYRIETPGYVQTGKMLLLK